MQGYTIVTVDADGERSWTVDDAETAHADAAQAMWDLTPCVVRVLDPCGVVVHTRVQA